MIKEVGSVNELGDDEEPPHQQHTRSVSEASSGTNRSSKLKTGGLRSSCNSKVSKTSTGFITASLSRFLMGVSAEATQSPKQNSATAPILKTAANGERRMSLSDFNHYTFIPDASAPKVSDTPSATTTGSSTKSPQPSTAISIPTDPLLVSVDKRRSAFIRYCARYIWSPVYTEFGMSAESEDGVVDTNAYKIKNPQRGVHPLSYFYALWQLFMASKCI